MDFGGDAILQAARRRAYSMPLAEIAPADPALFSSDTLWPYFERLRSEDPVHLAVDRDAGPYWSVTKFDDIMAVDTNHEVFSSERSITLYDPDADFELPMFIAMDPPKHDAQRKTVSPIVSHPNLLNLEPIIRERAGQILDGLPIGEEFDWVEKVSTELTTMTLATLFDVPWEDRRKLTHWSNVVTGAPEPGVTETARSLSRMLSPLLGRPGLRLIVKAARAGWSRPRRKAELFECLDYFSRLWEARAIAPPRNDLISMLAHGEATRTMDRMEYLGTLVLLIVGGNDTTRNTISGSVVALARHPDQREKLRDNPGLVSNMVSETLRWQSPIAYMRRTAKRDVELRDKLIRAGDKVLMWYVSGNRDDEAIDEPNRYDIERKEVRRHLSFGFGIHRCLGNRLAELQLQIIWEEILKRFPVIELAGEPQRAHSSFVRGYVRLPVRIPARL